MKRIHWIDIAKGLMIVGMVLNHIPNYCIRQGVDISSFPWWLTFGNAYGVFTMQSFFILSGYTTNFNLDLKTFLIKQVKGLLLPYLSFTLITGIFANYIWGEPFYFDVLGERWSFLVESYWFLTALFFAKVLMFFINKISRNNKFLELGGGILLLVIGIAISEYYSDMPEPSHWHNWFHYRNGLCMSLFLPIGYYLNKYSVVEKYGLVIGIVYGVFYCVTYLMSLLGVDRAQYLAAPNYTHYLVPNLNDVNGFFIIPAYLFYTVTGSIMVFWLSQKISKSEVLEYMGRESLIIYCVHFTFLTIYTSFFSSYIPHDGIMGAGLLFTSIGIATLISSAIMSKLFETKPLQYLIGKF